MLLTNCSNNYGPYQFPEKLIPLMILNAVEGKPLPIYGDGGNVRDWLYVEDHCRAILLVLQRGSVGEKYNIGGNSERTNLQVVDRLCEALEKWKPAASNSALQGRGVHVVRRAQELREGPPGPRPPLRDRRDQDRHELGFRPRYDFEAGLDATVRWYLENTAWCESVQSGRYRRERLGSGGRNVA